MQLSCGQVLIPSPPEVAAALARLFADGRGLSNKVLATEMGLPVTTVNMVMMDPVLAAVRTELEAAKRRPRLPRKRLQMEDVEKALTAQPTNLAAASRLLRVDAEVLQDFINNHEPLQAFLIQNRATLRSLAEAKLWEGVLQGDPAQVRYVLNNYGEDGQVTGTKPKPRDSDQDDIDSGKVIIVRPE